MKSIDPTQVRQSLRDSHLSGEGMESLKAMGRNGDPEALREVARKFESMFVHEMLKNMRSTNEIFGEDNFMSSSETKFHQEMLDQQLSLEMTKGRGLGLAEVLYEQMQRAYGEYLPPEKADTDGKELSRTYFPEPATTRQRVANSETLKADWVGPPATGGKTGVAKTPEEFVAQLRPYAERAASQLNLDSDVLLAQVALETGWGRQVIHNGKGENSHNLFNIKADQRWRGGSVEVPTIEYRQGVARQERASFREYKNYAQSFADYVDFIKSNPRYQDALKVADNPERYAEELQRAGYATDPEYANKIKALLDSEPVRSAKPGDNTNSNDT